MKTVWTILATIAIANLLALLGFVGWLAASDRLNRDRLQKIRAVLAPTLASEATAAKAAEDEAQSQAKTAAEAKRFEGTPESAAENIERTRAEEDHQLQTSVRLRREIDDLRRQVLADRVKVDEDRQTLAAEREAFNKDRTESTKLAASEQFKQALATLESQKPKDAQQVLKKMIDGQSIKQAVEYLAAMQERTRTKVMAEFIKGDPALAATLLERLRDRAAPSVATAAPPP